MGVHEVTYVSIYVSRGNASRWSTEGQQGEVQEQAGARPRVRYCAHGNRQVVYGRVGE